ncbi:MAG: hypothetical protein JRI97_06905 [Deltaproteobacteria bacterium]|nr:hypothetical protein [Deltaproteobacteria bacterium]
MKQRTKVGGVFQVVCRRSCGKVRWREQAGNRVTNEGLDHLLDVLFSSVQQAGFYVGLKGAGAAAADDTLASHSAWAEVTAYAGDRKAYSPSAAAAGSVSNAASKARFSINADGTEVAGVFLATTASGSAGVLLAVGDFALLRVCGAGDTIEVVYTFSAAGA